jgi:hypothetical protein
VSSGPGSAVHGPQNGGERRLETPSALSSPVDARLGRLLLRLDAADAEPDPLLRALQVRALVLAVLDLDALGRAL